MRLIPKNLRIFAHIKEHNWLIHQIVIEFIKESAPKYAHGTLVDIGCGVKPYKSIFASYVDKHIGIDLEQSPHGSFYVDVIANAYDTTLKESSCDLILCSEVLEHLEEPGKALCEMNRILKKKGIIILTVPFFWHIHEAPKDFYRYSEYGLRYLVEQAGFEIVELKPLTGFIATFSQLLIYFLLRFQKGLVIRTAGRLFNWVIQHFTRWLNKYDRSPEFTNSYGLIARKVKQA